MDLAERLAAAHITRIAIVDDDLSEGISIDDLQRVDPDVAALMADAQDPDRAAYMDLLLQLERQPDAGGDVAEPLSDPTVREQAPERIRHAADQVLAARHESAEPIRRVQTLLEALGIQHANIDHYSTAEIPANRRYDLLIVDYFLEEGSQEATLPFIRSVLGAHAGEDHPLQVILMSSHELELRNVFQQLRPELEVSSSRMRIMGKPATEDQILQWKLALNQLATERAHVRVVESFALATAASVRAAAQAVAKSVWELDLQAMDSLHETAVGDHDDYCRYVEECLSRQLLTRCEERADIRDALSALGDRLVQHRASKVTSPPAEIGDSRAALRSLMRSMEWRGGVIGYSPYQANATPLQKSQWLRANLRFGMVLRSPTGEEWLNLTQACDLAQAKDEQVSKRSLLLVAGLRHSPIDQPAGDAMVSMTTSIVDSGTEVMGWNLLLTLTPTIEQFGVDFGTGWAVVGELRIDQAQSLAVQYAARTARVGLPKRVSVWRLQGIAMRARELRDAPGTAALAGTPISGNAMARGDITDEVHIDRASFDRLLNTYPGMFDDRALSLYVGTRIKRGRKNTTGPPLVYCVSMPPSMGSLRSTLAHEQWLTRVENAENVLLALWPADAALVAG